MDDGPRAMQADSFAENRTSVGGTQRAILRPVPRRDPPSDRRAAVQEGEITLDAASFLRVALAGVALLAVLGLLAAYLGYVRADSPSRVLRAFLLNEEKNVPTFLAFSLLVFCSILLALIGTRAFLARQTFRFRWVLLAALFFLLAFDEAASLHEKLISPLREALDTSGWLYFAWVIPAGGFVAVLALFYVPFLRGLPTPFGKLFVLAGALYVGGALGVEMPGGAYAEAHGTQTFGFQLFATIEETLEMLGLTVFAYALMRFLTQRRGSVYLGFRAG